MNFIKKGITIIMFLAFTRTVLNAQNNDFSITPTLGLGSPILDGGLSCHLGVNPGLSVSPYFSVEGQLSYIYTKVNSAFLSGERGTSHSVNLLTGGRLYFIPDDKKVRPYINILLGGSYHREIEKSPGLKTTEFGLGLSAGAFVKIDNLVLGLSIDTPQHIILKVGYVF